MLLSSEVWLEGVAHRMQLTLAFSVAGNLYRSWTDGFEGTANESNKRRLQKV